MRVLLFFSVIVTACYGSHIKWTDFRGGNVLLPYYETQAHDTKWVAYDKDTSLKITWYRKHGDDSFSLAFDQNGFCAGAQITVFEREIDSKFISLYKHSRGIYEKTKVNNVDAYRSTVLFTNEKILKRGGRTIEDSKDVALDLYIKVNGKYTVFSKDGCITSKTYTEQSCQSSYGLVFSIFTKKSKCEDLIPFYTVYDPSGTGSLIGFGWISLHKVSSRETLFKEVSRDYVKNTFPQIPSCLNSCSNFAVVDVWFTYSTSQATRCSESHWTSNHCKSASKKRKRSSSSSSSSSSSDSSSDSDSS